MDKNDTFRTGDQSFLIAGAKVQIKIGLYKFICTKNYFFRQQLLLLDNKRQTQTLTQTQKASPTQTLTQTQNQFKKLITDKLIIFFRSFGVFESRELSILMPLAFWESTRQRVNKSTSSHPDEKAIADDYFVCYAQSIEENKRKPEKQKKTFWRLRSLCVCVIVCFSPMANGQWQKYNTLNRKM